MTVRDSALAEKYPDFVMVGLLEEGSGAELSSWFDSHAEPNLEALQARRRLTLRSLRFWRLVTAGILDTREDTVTSPAHDWWPL